MNYRHTLSLHHHTWQKSTASWTLWHKAQFQLLSNTMSNNSISEVKGYIIWQEAYILRSLRIYKWKFVINYTPQTDLNNIFKKDTSGIATSSFNMWASIPRKTKCPKRIPVSFGLVPGSNKHLCQTYTGSNTKPFFFTSAFTSELMVNKFHQYLVVNTDFSENK